MHRSFLYLITIMMISIFLTACNGDNEIINENNEFTSIETKSDQKNASRAEESTNPEEEVKENAYLEAVQLMENDQFVQALDLLIGIREYKDVSEKIKECLEKEAEIVINTDNGSMQDAEELYYSLVETCPKEAMEEILLISQLYADNERYYESVKILEIIDVSKYQHDVDPVEMLQKIHNLSDSVCKEQYQYFYDMAEEEYIKNNFIVAYDCYVYAGKEQSFTFPEENNYVLCNFMANIQGNYVDAENESANISGNIFRCNGEEYVMTPQEKQMGYISTIVAILNDNMDDYITYQKDGQIKSVINGESCIWNTEEFLDKEARIEQREEEKKQRENEKKREEGSKRKEQLANVPKIGMTADEVRKTNWGSPNKINRTTYSWGTMEQWCYSNNRYLYLEDGIVTSISESE